MSGSVSKREWILLRRITRGVKDQNDVLRGVGENQGSFITGISLCRGRGLLACYSDPGSPGGGVGGYQL